MSQSEPSPPSKSIVDLIIPARNEAEALPVLLDEIDRRHLRRIVVVDNGSSDATAEVAAARDCDVVDCPVPGYGRACLAGLAHLRLDPPDVVVFLDGDRSDHPRYLPQLIAPIASDEADFVLGSRTLGEAEKGSLTITQRFGNRLATSLMRLFWGVHYSDLAPFRAVRWTSLDALNMEDTNFGWTIEMQIKAHVHGLRFREVPVNYRNRIGVSKISGTVNGVIRAGTKIIYTIFRYKFLKPARKKGTTS